MMTGEGRAAGDAGEMGRRAFLGWAATGAAGLMLPGVIRPRAKVFDMGRGLRRDRLDAGDVYVGFYLVTAVEPFGNGMGNRVALQAFGPGEFGGLGERRHAITFNPMGWSGYEVGDVIGYSATRFDKIGRAIHLPARPPLIPRAT